MAQWAKCTNTHGSVSFVNLDNAMSITRAQNDNYTTISFPGGDEGVVRVRETPEEIFENIVER